MKQGRLLPAVFGSVLIASAAGYAETIRPLMSRENRLPELYQLEISALGSYTEFEEKGSGSPKRHEGIGELTARFGLLENLSVFAAVPYGVNDSDLIGKQNGLRDVKAGIELLAYEHAYGYPYVIPYGEVSIPTGDEDKLLGTGEFGGTFGAAIGTTTYDIYHYVLDGRYEYSEKSNKSQGLFGASAAFIWDLSDRFSVLAEAKVTEKPKDSDNDVPAYFKGGMCYEATENLSIYWYGGAAINTEEKGSGTIKMTYRF